MASIQIVSQELSTELGLLQPRDQENISVQLGDAAVDLFSQNEGRYKPLKRRKIIAVTVALGRNYKLPSDFNSARAMYHVSDTDSDDILDDWNIISKDAFVDLKERGKNLTQFAYIDNPAGERQYKLFLALAPTASVTLALDYYRHPTMEDFSHLDGDGVLAAKSFVRARNPKDGREAQAQADMRIYLELRKKFATRAERFVTQSRVLPSHRVMATNQEMWDIGRVRK
ncbi:MAG: hypothetical protein ACE5GA_00180 [Candidatus Zixiibacteriota bacterium]